MIVTNLYIKFDSWEESNLAMEKIFADRNVASVTLFGTNIHPINGYVIQPSGYNTPVPRSIKDSSSSVDYCQAILAKNIEFFWQFFPVFHSDTDKSNEEIFACVEKPMQALKMIKAPLVTRKERDRVDALEDKLNLIVEKLDSLENRLESKSSN